MEDRRFRWAAFLALAIAAFGHFLTNPFVFDDIRVIQENTWLAFSTIPNFFRSFVFEPSLSFHGFRPLPMTLYSILYEIFGKDPLFFRLLNLAIHLGNALILDRLTLQVLPKISNKNRFLLVAIFLAHPVQSNLISLAWNLPDLLFISGSLLSIFFFLQHKFGLGLLGVLIAVLSKENALILPPFLLFLSLGIWGGKRAPIWTMLCLLALFLAHATLIFYIQPKTIAAAGITFSNTHPPSTHLGQMDYLLTQIAALPSYLQTVIFPLRLRPFHRITADVGPVLLGILLLLTWAFAFLFSIRKKPDLCLPLLFLFLFMLPGMLIPLNLPFDEDRMALPLVGLLWTLFFFWEPSKRAQKFIMALLCLFLIQNLHQSRIWRSSENLWRHNTEVDPEDARGWLALGLALKDPQDKRESMDAFAKAAILEPGFSKAHLELGKLFLSEGKLEKARVAIGKAKTNSGLRADALMHLGIISAKQGREKEAEKLFLESLREDPRQPPSYRNLAVLYQNQGRREEAIQVLKNALRISPSDPKTLEMLKVFENLLENPPSK